MTSYPFIDLKSTTQHQRKELNETICNVLDDAHYLFGTQVAEFEQKFAEWVGTKYCVGAANGTSALEMALVAAGVQKGDKVVTQTNTFAASVFSIIHAGAVPILVDCDARGYINMKEVEEVCKCNDVKALMIVHMYGGCTDMDTVSEFIDKNNMLLIEDCAQAHGTEWKGRKVGTFGHAGCFSFYPGKNLGACGDAGAIVTNDLGLAERARTYGNIGARKKYYHEMVGINSRMDTIQAAILCVKLPMLDSWNKSRRTVAEWYEEMLSDVPTVSLLQPPSENTDKTHTYHLMVVVLDDSVCRDDVLEQLSSSGIGCLIHYPVPCHRMDAMKHEYMDEYAKTHPNSEYLSGHMLSLPIHPYITREEVFDICAVLSSFIL